MAAKLILAPEAEQDIGEAYNWYEQRRAGLGEEFLGCIDACIQSICRSPETFSIVFQDYRRAMVRRSPQHFGAASLQSALNRLHLSSQAPRSTEY
jgi:hypothetical protein